MSRDENQSALSHAGVVADEAGRRRFLKAAALSSLALPFGVAMTHAKGLRRFGPGLSPTPFWKIEAARVEQTFSDGSMLAFHRYRALGPTPVAGTVPVLTGVPGETARLRVRNSLPYTIRPTVVGSSPGPSVAPGDDVVFDLVVPPEGTWLLTDAALGDAAGPMGLGAVIISRSPRTWKQIQPAYDREYVLLYNDSDDRWNGAIDAGGVPDYGVYEPNYHTLNNLTYPDTTADARTTVSCNVGDRVLLRMCNLGWVRQSIHFHGYHVDIERINNQPQTIYGPKDTIPLPGHSTMEVLLTVNQPGIFPFHPHSLTTTTDNGLYIGGQITLIIAS